MSTPTASYVVAQEPTKPIAHKEPRAFAPYDTDVEHYTYGQWEYDLMDAPRDCMVRSALIVSIAQVSARVHAGSYRPMLWEQVGFYAGFFVLMAIEYVIGTQYVGWDSELSMSSFLLYSGLVILATIALACFWSKRLAMLRTTVRERFQIEGSTSDDWWAMCCCLPCAVAQMARQTNSSELGTCDMLPRDALPAYQA